MGIGDLFRRRHDPATARVEPPVVTAGDVPSKAAPQAWLQDIGWGGGVQSRVKSLPRVTPTTAERHATVFACCNNLAGDHAKVPLQLWQRKPDGTESQVFDHPAIYLMNVESAPGVPAAVTRFALVYAFSLRGVSYAYAPRDGAGELLMVDGLSPDGVSVTRSGRMRFYDFEDGAGVYRRARSRSMVHMRYMALDGWTHRSPLTVASESMGLAMAGQEAAARTAAGGTTKAAIKLSDAYEDDDARQRSARRIKAALTDPTDGSFPVLNADEDIQKLDLSAADQELLASRKFDREMIAAIYRMPPSKLQMLENGVKANGQQQAIDYLTDCLMHWQALIAPQYDQALLTAGERAAGLFFRHDFSALLEPTTAELFNALKVAVGGPFMTPNDAQARARLPKTANGDQLYPPSNMTRDDTTTTEKEGAET
ncbi:phage portal protein [Loktanella sp. 3ANDIMAR09]|uniref:phage portal protein n=1 Tax=Loktanella sp. 3ANDIMAR09 TaxID=1225657 RepID=UPI0007013D1C|nr:phage portal protein [Loktanella sp. 3ANDIMAR09]KQI66959.1 phage portal protein [Loktanella sp. 3ANDIMAR09]